MSEKFSSGSSSATNLPYKQELTKWESFKDGFRKLPEDVHLDTDDEEHGSGKNLSQKHVIMIALSTGVGTGLWVGTGKSLSIAGPAGLLIGYALISSMIYFVIDAAGELAVAYGGLTGAFNAYHGKFIDKSLGFAIGWNYAIQWLTVFSLELVAASMTIKYWTNINSDIFVAMFYVLILSINFFGAKGYGSAEFVFNTFKMLTICGFAIFGIITDVGGSGDRQYIGAKYWSNPGAFNHGFKGVCSVFVSAAFAFGGTEFVALTAADQKNPRRAIPQAIKIVGYRILFVFMLSLTLITMLVPYNSDQLMGSKGNATHASPFVLAASLHGVRVIPNIINSIILLSVLSVANSAVYCSSKTLQSMADQGLGPKCLKYVDKKGRPLVGLIIASIAGLFGFIAAYENHEAVFSWLLSISGLSSIFTFGGICVSHIRFRAAMKAQKRSLEQLGYRARFGKWGSLYATTVIVFILCVQFWIALIPVGSSKPNVQSFFQNYLGFCVLVLFYFGHKIVTGNWVLYIRASEIDLASDMKEYDVDMMEQEEREKRENKRWWWSLFNFFC